MKYLAKEVSNALDLGDKNKKKVEKLQTFDSNYFLGKSHFEDDKSKNYLVFQPVFKYFKKLTNSDTVTVWKSEGF